jgi:hypothetical protein
MKHYSKALLRSVAVAGILVGSVAAGAAPAIASPAAAPSATWHLDSYYRGGTPGQNLQRCQFAGDMKVAGGLALAWQCRTGAVSGEYELYLLS